MATTPKAGAVSRTELLRIANLVRPALSTADYIPALKHIAFDGAYALAYNDIAAISVRAAVPIHRLVLGDLLIRALGTFGGDVVVTEIDNALLLQSGRSKLKVPTLPVAEFPFVMPDDIEPAVTMTADIIAGIKKCLVSAGTDTKLPAQCGVTMEAVDGLAVLYSTDNIAISRYETDSPLELVGDVPVVMPTFFCEQLVALAANFDKSDPVMVITPGALIAEFANVDAILYCKTVIDVEPIDFGRILAKFLGTGSVVEKMVKIPDALDGAVGRALLVHAGTAVRTTEITAAPDGLTLHSSTQAGDSDDHIECKPHAAWSSQKFYVDPSTVARGLKTCSKMAALPKTLVLGDAGDKYLHLIAHVMPV